MARPLCDEFGSVNRKPWCHECRKAPQENVFVLAHASTALQIANDPEGALLHAVSD